MLASGEPLRTRQTPAWAQQTFSQSRQSAKPWHSDWCGRPGDKEVSQGPHSPLFPKFIFPSPGHSSWAPSSKVLRPFYSVHLRPDIYHWSSKASASQTWKSIQITWELVKNAVGLGWGLRVYVSNKLPADTHAAGPQTILWRARIQMTVAVSTRVSQEESIHPSPSVYLSSRRQWESYLIHFWFRNLPPWHNTQYKPGS